METSTPLARSLSDSQLVISRSFSDEDLGEVFSSQPVIREVRQISVNDAVEQAFGLNPGQIAEEGGLSKGHALLNQEFSAWKLAETQAGSAEGLTGFFSTLWIFLTQGSTLLEQATANQELLKNPTEVTQAVKYLAGLRDRGVTIDLDQYREHGLALAKGDRHQINTENAVEQSSDLILGSIKENSKTGAFVTSSQKRKALKELEQAVHAVAQLSDDFDAQRQMVAVVTMNIARAAGIADGSREMEVLVDQMSHLWLKTTPMAGEMTPLAVINYADKLAQEFDANDLDSVYDKVQAHAALFAQASLTNLSGVAEDDMEALEKATAKFQTQIWDALKANPKFQLKMKLAVRNINQRIGELHNLTTTTDHVSAEVMKRFKGISRENLGTQTGEMHFIAQVMSTYGMTDDVFTLLRAYDGTFDRASGTWERMPLEDVQNAFVGTSMSETLAAVIEENTEAGTVDIFKVFTDDRILGQAAVMQERARLMAQGQTSQISSDEAKRSLFKLFISYSKELTVQYEEALDYLRNEPYPRMAAVNHYQPGEKQVELEGLRRELQSLAVLASQGTTDKPELQETLSGDGAARALNAIATPQGLREDIVDMFAEPYVQSLGIRDPRDIDDTPLQDRYNLQDKDYYRMLETAMGLREANVAGSATLTHETLEFLGTDAAAYILLTQGRLSRKEYSELLKSSSNAKAAHDAVKEALEGITLPVTTRSGKAFFITLPNGEKMELRNFDEEQKAAFEQLLITQRTNFAKAEETESLISSLPPAPLKVDESVESEAPLTPEAILAAIAQDGPEETARRLARMTLRVEELNDSHDSLVAEISAELTNLQVDETKEEAFDTLLQIMGIEEEEENLSRLDRGKIKAALEQSSPEAVAQFMINHLYGKEIDVAVEGTPKNQHDQMREYLRILALSQSVSQKDKAFRDLNALYSEIEQAN